MSRIINGDTVVHFKGQMYTVISIDAEHTEDGEKYVCYRALYDEKKTYVRPYDMFMSKVDKTKYPDVTAEYRMTVYCTEDVPTKSKELSEVSIEDALRMNQDGQILKLDTHQDVFGYAIYQGILISLRDVANNEDVLTTIDTQSITNTIVLNGDMLSLPYPMDADKLRHYLSKCITAALGILKGEECSFLPNMAVRVF